MNRYSAQKQFWKAKQGKQGNNNTQGDLFKKLQVPHWLNRRPRCVSDTRRHVWNTLVPFSFSTPQNWSRSRTSRRTRSSWERLSNTVTSSRYQPHLFSKRLWFPSGPCPDLCLCLLKLCICHRTVWAKPVLGLFAPLHLWPEVVLSCCVAHKWLQTSERVSLWTHCWVSVRNPVDQLVWIKGCAIHQYLICLSRR